MHVDPINIIMVVKYFYFITHIKKLFEKYDHIIKILTVEV